MTPEAMREPTLLERWEKVGQVLGAAFDANHPCMLDFAHIGFAIKGITNAKIPAAAAREGDTPRTDEAAFTRFNDVSQESEELVYADFSRQIELELRSANARADEAELEHSQECAAHHSTHLFLQAAEQSLAAERQRVDRLVKIVQAVQCSEVTGITMCNDVDGENWFDARDEAALKGKMG